MKNPQVNDSCLEPESIDADTLACWVAGASILLPPFLTGPAIWLLKLGLSFNNYLMIGLAQFPTWLVMFGSSLIIYAFLHSLFVNKNENGTLKDKMLMFVSGLSGFLIGLTVMSALVQTSFVNALIIFAIGQASALIAMLALTLLVQIIKYCAKSYQSAFSCMRLQDDPHDSSDLKL
jgi:hypothetical protein